MLYGLEVKDNDDISKSAIESAVKEIERVQDPLTVSDIQSCLMKHYVGILTSNGRCVQVSFSHNLPKKLTFE